MAMQSYDAKLGFRFDTGDTKGGKPVYKNMSLAGIDGEGDHDEIESAARIITGLSDWTCDRITFVHTQVIELL